MLAALGSPNLCGDASAERPGMVRRLAGSLGWLNSSDALRSPVRGPFLQRLGHPGLVARPVECSPMTPVELAKAALREIASNMMEPGGCTHESELERRKEIAREVLSALEAEGADGWRPDREAVRTAVHEAVSRARSVNRYHIDDRRENALAIVNETTDRILALPPSPALADDQGEKL